MSESFEQSIFAVETISLEEINREASLQTRHDRKYLLGRTETTRFLNWLRQTPELCSIKVLQHKGIRTHAYQSTYFDTSNLRCYKMGLQRARYRFKVRTRTYRDSDLTFLEVKTKSREGTVKNRICWNEPQSLNQDGRQFVSHVLTSTNQTLLECSNALAPSLETSYLRTTVLAMLAPTELNQGQQIRITFDQNLSWAKETGEKICANGNFIVETKSPGNASLIDRHLWNEGHRPLPVSKYMVGQSLFDPSLPRSRWARAARILQEGATQGSHPRLLIAAQ